LGEFSRFGALGEAEIEKSHPECESRMALEGDVGAE
jgi:hypothetical protein